MLSGGQEPVHEDGSPRDSDVPVLGILASPRRVYRFFTSPQIAVGNLLFRDGNNIESRSNN
jgi:hypothetical protein